LVGQPDPVGEEVLAGPDRGAQLHGGRRVGDERAEAGAVGAQGVGQDERVEPVVLVPGRAVAAAEVVDLVGADHHDGEALGEEGVDDLSVAAFDRDFADAGAAQPADELAQPGAGGVDEELLEDGALVVHDGDGVVGVVGGGPVQAGGDVAGRGLRQNGRGRCRGGGAGWGGRHVVLRWCGRRRARGKGVLGHGSRIAHCSALTLALSPCRRSARPR
jgi:hypothetical protein